MFEAFPSQFSSVLNTNYAASAIETQIIHTLLASPCDELSELAEEIDRVQKTLNSLIFRHNLLKTHVDAHLALTSPFRRLPREIISEIFIQCLPSDRNPTRSLTEAPLLLTTISKDSRELALSTPQLWTNIHVYLPHRSLNGNVDIDEMEALVQRRRAGIEAWLTRSKCLPLSISVHLSGYGRLTGSDSTAYISFLECIVSFAPRWKRIQLHLSPFFVDLLNTLVNDLKPEDVPWLESVEIFYNSGIENGRASAGVYSSYTGNHKPLLPLSELIIRAPSLQSFAVHCHSQSLHQLQLPWSNLTDLTMQSRRGGSRLTLNQTMHVLASSPNLSTCTLGVMLTSNDGVPGNIIEFHSLRALSLDFSLPSDAVADLPASEVENRLHSLFNAIRAPLLSKLAFVAKGFEFRRELDCVPFKPLLKRSGCKLEELYLSCPLKSQTTLLDCLRTLPTITHIYLESCTSSENRFDIEPDSTSIQIVDDTFIGHLTVTENDPTPICPRLEKLLLSECKHVSEETLVSFAQSRAIGAPRCVSGEIASLKLLDVRFPRARPEYSAEQSGASLSSKIAQLHSTQGVVVNWRYLVPEIMPSTPIADSPWEGLPTSPYSGWNPSFLS
ncbi:hypothetical protein J3R30DRAFT_3481614 [Lentinula aciculospora]|uniref:F-box domain-containing protein n=1 Tax=Lentinula aciculospora TaxID=153920 RepID=A0A9W9ADG5_9AGAR|nr:hypothetical protein J3R30DRAFT_3481614 [Lentinula aciculospora]